MFSEHTVYLSECNQIRARSHKPAKDRYIFFNFEIYRAYTRKAKKVQRPRRLIEAKMCTHAIRPFDSDPTKKVQCMIVETRGVKKRSQLAVHILIQLR